MIEGLPEIAPFRDRWDQLNTQLADPDIFADARKATALAREHQKLSQLLEVYAQLETNARQLAENRELLADPAADAELCEIAESELETMEARETALRAELLTLVIPPEPADERNIVMEIRGGAGGDEANIFAGDLYRMYARYAETKRWEIEPMSASLSEAGGYKEIIFLLKGDQAYKHLKFESGVHRVQRVPATESQGRIHTSTATVAVLPEAKEVDIEIDPADIEITVARASGPGGQGVNTTDSAVQILHKPTGMIVACADERSQLKNRNKAMAVLRARLLQREQDEEQKKYAAHRRSQVGTGDRSERIRTYNFPQSRLTDHRIGFNSHDLEMIMEGELDDLFAALQQADLDSRMESFLADQERLASQGADEDRKQN